MGGRRCAECSAGLLHSLLAGCVADLLEWRGVCAAATARGVPPRASRTVELRRAGRGALWYGMVPEAVCRRLQKAQTDSERARGALDLRGRLPQKRLAHDSVLPVVGWESTWVWRVPSFDRGNKALERISDPLFP